MKGIKNEFPQADSSNGLSQLFEVYFPAQGTQYSKDIKNLLQSVKLAHKDQCPDMHWKIISATKKFIIFAFSADNCTDTNGNNSRFTIGKIMSDNTGVMYVLQYTGLLKYVSQKDLEAGMTTIKFAHLER